MLDREVAIKVLRQEMTMHHSLVERFRKEAMVLAKLIHPNIALLYNLFQQGDQLFMVMEFVSGETLEWQLKREGALLHGQAIALFVQILDAIGYAHQHGVIHRDIKPSNIMILPDGRVKVMDFGIARVLGTERMTRDGSVIGTVEYMSPEQIRGQESSEASDIYSLGVLLFEMVSRRLPFSGQNQFDLMRAHIEDTPPPLREFIPSIPEHIEQAVLRALEKRKEDRFRSAGEFRAALQKGVWEDVRLPIRDTMATRPLRKTATYVPGDREDEVELAAAEARHQLIEEAGTAIADRRSA
jgi:serine/threonine-protein kinase